MAGMPSRPVRRASWWPDPKASASAGRSAHGRCRCPDRRRWSPPSRAGRRPRGLLLGGLDRGGVDDAVAPCRPRQFEHPRTLLLRLHQHIQAELQLGAVGAGAHHRWRRAAWQHALDRVALSGPQGLEVEHRAPRRQDLAPAGIHGVRQSKHGPVSSRNGQAYGMALARSGAGLHDGGWPRANGAPSRSSTSPPCVGIASLRFLAQPSLP